LEAEGLNFRHLVWDRVWLGLAMGSGGYTAIFALRQGAEPQHLSLMAAIPGLMMLLATFFSVIWRGRYASSAAAQIWPGVLSGLMYLLPAFTPFLPFVWRPWYLIFALSLPALGEGLAVGIRIALVRESIGEGRRTALIGRRQMALKLSAAGGALAFGYWLEAAPYPLNYQAMYGLAFGLSLVSTWHFTQTRPLYVDQSSGAGPPGSAWGVWRDGRFRRAALLVMVVFGAFLSVQALIPARLVGDLGAEEGFFALYGLVDLVAGTAAAALSVKIGPRLGHSAMTGLAMLGTALGLAIIALTPTLYPALMAAALFGAAWTAADIGQFGYFLAHIPAENAIHYTAAYMQLLSVASFIMPLLGGFLLEQGLSLVSVLWIGAGLRLLAALLSLMMREKKDD
jgi:MFS family permease